MKINLCIQNAISEFLEEFLPHMEEEENTFLPLLCKYFDYDELKEIKVSIVFFIHILRYVPKDLKG